MMRKIIQSGAYDFGSKPVEQIKISGTKLRGNDLRSFVKRAGVRIADEFTRLSLAPGEIPIHLIALGASDFFGPNRNGDAFTSECCRKYHPTFVKHARFYRNHANKDPQKSYGIVKYSTYNEDMHRIELIVALNGTKEAAERNGGLVADKEMDKLASADKDWAVSMACSVPFDVCSVCGNKAKTRADYCTGTDEGGSCAGGGCRHNLCKVAEDGTITFVYNPDPKWFDISDVYKPADRIAYVFGGFNKTANKIVKSGAELAEELRIYVPADVVLTSVDDPAVRRQVRLAYQLADLEKTAFVTPVSTIPDSRTCVTDIGTVAKAAKDRNTRADILGALAKERIVLSPFDFLKFSGCSDTVAAEVTSQLTGCTHSMFTQLLDDSEQLVADIASLQFKHATTLVDKWATWAQGHAAAAALIPTHSVKRAWCHALNRETVAPVLTKQASPCDSRVANVLRVYALYKLAFVDHVLATTNGTATDLVTATVRHSFL